MCAVMRRWVQEVVSMSSFGSDLFHFLHVDYDSWFFLSPSLFCDARGSPFRVLITWNRYSHPCLPSTKEKFWSPRAYKDVVFMCVGMDDPVESCMQFRFFPSLHVSFSLRKENKHYVKSTMENENPWKLHSCFGPFVPMNSSGLQSSQGTRILRRSKV
jgi:hypothetical protein